VEVMPEIFVVFLLQMTGFLQKLTDFPLNPVKIRWPNFGEIWPIYRSIQPIFGFHEFSCSFRVENEFQLNFTEFYQTFRKPTGSLGHEFFWSHQFL
jgi:hypothetical protein